MSFRGGSWDLEIELKFVEGYIVKKLGFKFWMKFGWNLLK